MVYFYMYLSLYVLFVTSSFLCIKCTQQEARGGWQGLCSSQRIVGALRAALKLVMSVQLRDRRRWILTEIVKAAGIFGRERERNKHHHRLWSLASPFTFSPRQSGCTGCQERSQAASLLSYACSHEGETASHICYVFFIVGLLSRFLFYHK